MKVQPGDKVVLTSSEYEHATKGSKGVVTGFINDCAATDFGYGVVCVRPEDLQLDVLEQLATVYGGPNHDKPDERPRVHVCIITYGPSEGGKADVFGASLDFNVTLQRAQKEADELRLWECMRTKELTTYRWAGDDGENMWIESLPLEGNALDILAAST